ncbi:MAG: carboxypeptidase-like regulatory domain-containing protein, partial [Cyclobacteriaceae bacterium]|nr:carboxypeptidase-like regulatory domain-containing protein [Cyclobacteriaceae bacterium]
MLLACHAVRAQDLVLTGRVATATGESLPGVNVLVKGTNVGTMTDANGSFKIAAGNATLVFSYIGYKTVELATNGRTSL